eukprot:SAG25_NODE_1188_length_3659_cov_9.430618_4_plen_91_part_00
MIVAVPKHLRPCPEEVVCLVGKDTVHRAERSIGAATMSEASHFRQYCCSVAFCVSLGQIRGPRGVGFHVRPLLVSGLRPPSPIRPTCEQL